MTTATKIVWETLDLNASRVDRDARVIRHVKVLGADSKNVGSVLGLDRREFGEACNKPYRYDAAAMSRALPLYERSSVNIDHLQSAFDRTGARTITGGRSVSQRIGQLVNCTSDATGIWGDLEYLESHPMAAALCEMAERMPDQVALSHHATCQFELVNGQAVCVGIEDVRSVDLIADPPGTTLGLFESKAREVFGNPKPQAPRRRRKLSLSESLGKGDGKAFSARVHEIDDSLGLDAGAAYPSGKLPKPGEKEPTDAEYFDEPNDEMADLPPDEPAGVDPAFAGLEAEQEDGTLDALRYLTRISHKLSMTQFVRACSALIDNDPKSMKGADSDPVKTALLADLDSGAKKVPEVDHATEPQESLFRPSRKYFIRSDAKKFARDLRY